MAAAGHGVWRPLTQRAPRCAQNATSYGKGVYFGRDASYSANPLYSRPDDAGVQRMFACHVLVGEFHLGRLDQRVPDVRVMATNTLYDSTYGIDTFNRDCVQSAEDPAIFVTYHDAQAYPAYVVEFKDHLGGLAKFAAGQGAAKLAAAAALFKGSQPLSYRRATAPGRLKPLQSAPKAPDGADLMRALRVAPYGALGSAMHGGKAVDAAPAPEHVAEGIVVVDPAGLEHIAKLGPRRAGGAAGAIYHWLGIAHDASFCADVVAAVRETGDAKYVDYGGGKHVIHAVGPDLRHVSPDARADVVAALARGYANVLREFEASRVPTLRLVPMSGGIFAGGFADAIPTLTCEALRAGFDALPPASRSAILARHIELCIFVDKEVALFEAAVADAREL